jgi:hypothetical protein
VHLTVDLSDRHQDRMTGNAPVKTPGHTRLCSQHVYVVPPGAAEFFDKNI